MTYTNTTLVADALLDTYRHSIGQALVYIKEICLDKLLIWVAT